MSASRLVGLRRRRGRTRCPPGSASVLPGDGVLVVLVHQRPPRARARAPPRPAGRRRGRAGRGAACSSPASGRMSAGTPAAAVPAPPGVRPTVSSPRAAHLHAEQGAPESAPARAGHGSRRSRRPSAGPWDECVVRSLRAPPHPPSRRRLSRHPARDVRRWLSIRRRSPSVGQVEARRSAPGRRPRWPRSCSSTAVRRRRWKDFTPEQGAESLAAWTDWMPAGRRRRWSTRASRSGRAPRSSTTARRGRRATRTATRSSRPTPSRARPRSPTSTRSSSEGKGRFQVEVFEPAADARRLTVTPPATAPTWSRRMSNAWSSSSVPPVRSPEAGRVDGDVGQVPAPPVQLQQVRPRFASGRGDVRLPASTRRPD